MNIRENLKNNIDALRKLAFNEVVEEVAEPTAEATEETTETEVSTEETTETEKENFVDAQLADGTIINIEPDIELGASVAVVTEEGVVPAPDAEHELASGEKIVTVGGVITEIIPSEEEVAEEEAVEEIDEELSDEVAEPAPKTVIERTEVERKFAELEEKLAEALKSNDEFKSQVVKTLEELSKEPSAAPTIKRKSDAFKREEPSFQDKLNIIKKLKK
jgi:K+/H+ antiporter YhaU regulatory subunit KhtT